jgi:hypothetical protein
MAAHYTTPESIAKLVAEEQREYDRASMWEMIPVKARAAALMMAHLSPERASNPLTTFSRGERSLVVTAIGILTSHLGMAAHCMRDTTAKVHHLMH